jgi:hypothetical protein
MRASIAKQQQPATSSQQYVCDMWYMCVYTYVNISEIYLKYISSISYQKYIIIFFEGEEIKYIY